MNPLADWTDWYTGSLRTPSSVSGVVMRVARMVAPPRSSRAIMAGPTGAAGPTMAGSDVPGEDVATPWAADDAAQTTTSNAETRTLAPGASLFTEDIRSIVAQTCLARGTQADSRLDERHQLVEALRDRLTLGVHDQVRGNRRLVGR